MSIFLHWSQVAAKMGRTSKWLKSFLGSSKKEKSRDDEEKNGLNQPSAHDEHLAIVSANPPTKEKRRWSFRRSVNRDTNSLDQSMNASSAVTTTSSSARSYGDSEDQQKKHAIAVAAATAAAADAAIAAAQAAAAVIRLTTTTRQPTAAEERAATKIQAAFRSYLARKALRALRGLVKLQALVRGHLVRRQATATLRCMHALVTVQARARAQRLQMFDEAQPTMQRSSTHRRSAYENKFRQSTDMDRMTDENVKIVEMDMGESRGVKSKINYISPQEEQYRRYLPPLPKLDHIQSPAPSSVLTDASPRACSGHFEEFSFATTAKSSPQYFSDFSRPYLTRGSFGASQIEYAESISNDYLFPNYMANTESSKAKARSQSAPKQRPDSYDKTPTKKKGSADGRGVPRGVKMQRSSSHVGATCKGYHYTPSGSIKLDRSTVSLKDSECGSTCSVLTDVNYCRSLVAIEAYSHRL